MIKIPFYFRKKRSKYGNTITTIDDIKFDSKKEADFYLVLKLKKDQCEIVELKLQEPFPIVINDKKICTYYADFVTYDKEGVRVIYDVKGVLTPMYRLKKKLVEATYNVNIVEV